MVVCIILLINSRRRGLCNSTNWNDVPRDQLVESCVVYGWCVHVLSMSVLCCMHAWVSGVCMYVC